MLHYQTYEHPTSNKWVTFVHGAGGSSSIWFKQIKAFKRHFNVLLLDLRGHGKSGENPVKKVSEYSFEVISEDVLEVLDYLKIEKTHFIGISLGTIIIREIAERYPERVDSMIMGGAIMRLNVRGQVLMKLGYWLKSVLPYLLLYKLFAFIIMPKKKHGKSRNLFIEEAKKLYQKEFIRWYKLTTEVNPLLKLFREKDTGIPTLYIMGEEDYMFLEPIRALVKSHNSAQLHVIDSCGHVVNVDAPMVFNETAIGFIDKH